MSRAIWPVSPVCPDCGGCRYTTTKPVGFIAFVRDRVCKDCGVRYTPPTPAWAGLLFVLGGWVMALGCGTVAAITPEVTEPAWASVAVPFNLAIFGGLAFVSFLAIGHGARSLVSARRA